MGDRAADRVDRRVADDEVVVGAVGTEGIVGGSAELRASLPPAVLAADHPRIETLVQPRAGPDLPLRRLDGHPVARADAPLGGRCYLPHGDGRFTAVFDVEDGIPLAFEVACREARLAVLATVQAEGKLDPTWVQSQCNRICEVVEEASTMLRSLSAIERNAGAVRDYFTQMRKQILELIDELREQAD